MNNIDVTPPRWFEFLLEPGLLEQHLEANSCDPSPTELIALFYRNVPLIDNDSSDLKYRTKKAHALQTLAVKVASFVKWDLDLICNNLTIPIQYKLMQSLNLACSSKNCPNEVKKFSNIIYWHWFVRSAITYQISILQPQFNNTTIIYLSQLQQQEQAAESSALYSMGELFAPKSEQLKSCSTQLHEFIWELSHNKDNSPKKIKGSYHPFKKAKLSMPLMDCFDSTKVDSNDWSKCEQIESKEFIEAACYDLGKFFFFEESYKLSKESFDIIKESNGRFPKLAEYLQSATEMLIKNENIDIKKEQKNGFFESNSITGDLINCDQGNDRRRNTEKYLFDCMTEFSKTQKKDNSIGDEANGNQGDSDIRFEQDSDLRIVDNQNQNNAWYAQIPATIQQQQLFEAAKGDAFMTQGDFKQAMGCFVGSLMLMTDYFRIFSKGYVDEEPYITRMIQCSISLSCFTQAVALCQMSRNLNYTIAFKQLNERVCNDCCDDIYECIWNVTLLEYIINLHSKRGEVERRTKVIHLIGQLELNENNPEEILREAEHVRRGKFFKIMSNKYL